MAAFGFSPSTDQTSDPDNYAYQQNGGCAVRVYANLVDGDTRDATTDLFMEIKACDTDRSTTDVAGAFSFTLLATQNWDEIIRPEDFVRIFLGDQIVTSNGDVNSYNFASGEIGLQSSLVDLSAQQFGITVPIPNSGTPGNFYQGGKVGNSDGLPTVAKLIMQERFIGKVDRVSRITAGPGPNQGTTVAFTVSGRSLGSIIEDISLYYNDYLGPLNAVNMFLDSGLSQVDTSPDQIVHDALLTVLMSIPFPQWTLPDALVSDLNPGPGKFRDAQLVAASELLQQYRTRLNNPQTSISAPASYKGDVVSKMNSLLNSSGTTDINSPICSISLDGILPCFGRNFDRSFLQSVTTGLFDLIKELSNPAWNELFFDLCPNGDPNGGTAADDILYPTIVLRPRPFNITQAMLNGLPDFLQPAAAKIHDFPAENIENAASASLLDIMPSSFSVFGPMANPNIDLSGTQFSQFADGDDDIAGGFTPSVMPNGYDCGYSGHDRQNFWIVTGSYAAPQSTAGSSLVVAVQSNSVQVNIESIKKYGMRSVWVSTPYFQPEPDQVQAQSLGDVTGPFTNTLANWNFMNDGLLNGRITCRFLRRARVGVPVKYFETRITPQNPYPRMEVFYVQGVSDHFEAGQPISTTLTVIRGLRYDLSQAGDSLIATASSLLGAEDIG